jgi:hypothetical protein
MCYLLHPIKKYRHFESSLVKKMAPKWFNKFTFVPSVGASRGIFVGWNSSIFEGAVKFTSRFAITIHFSSTHSAEEWTLMMVYGPCHGQERQDFINWLNGLQIDDDANWLIIGDFNFYKSLEDRNKGGGNMQDIIIFNEVISNLGLQEIPLKGRSYIGIICKKNP